MSRACRCGLLPQPLRQPRIRLDREHAGRTGVASTGRVAWPVPAPISKQALCAFKPQRSRSQSNSAVGIGRPREIIQRSVFAELCRAGR